MSTAPLTGIHTLIRTEDIKDYFKSDVDFKEVYDLAENTKKETVLIAVIDEGVHKDKGLPGVPPDGFLEFLTKDHVVSTGIPAFNETQISHGTRVAALACWGSSHFLTDMFSAGHMRTSQSGIGHVLGLLDYRVRTQAAVGSIGAREADKEVPLVKTAMEAAVRAGASVVVSALATENKKKVYTDNGVDKVIKDNPGVLFVFGAGNNGRDLDTYDVCLRA